MSTLILVETRGPEAQQNSARTASCLAEQPPCDSAIVGSLALGQCWLVAAARPCYRIGSVTAFCRATALLQYKTQQTAVTKAG